MRDSLGNLHKLSVRTWAIVRDENGGVSVKSVTWDFGFEWFSEDRKGFLGYDFKKPLLQNPTDRA